jgi:hypothetical protein
LLLSILFKELDNEWVFQGGLRLSSSDIIFSFFYLGDWRRILMTDEGDG